MRNNMGEQVTAGLVGAAGAAMFWWNQQEQQRDDRIRNLRSDNQSLQNQLNNFLSSGDWQRLNYPTVRDTLVGFASAQSGTPSAAAVPPIANGATRPDLSSGANVPFMQWPPVVGNYDSSGRAPAPGELAQGSAVLTYQEPRAFLQGLCLKSAPGDVGKVQLFTAAQALSTVVTQLQLSPAQYVQAWHTLFEGASAETPSTQQAAFHQDPAAAPTATSLAGTQLAVVPLSSTTVPGFPYYNPNTDAAQRWRLTVSSDITAGKPLIQVSFGREYKYSNHSAVASFQPVVTPSMTLGANGQALLLYPTQVTSTGFVLQSPAVVPTGTYDVFIAVQAGIATV